MYVHTEISFIFTVRFNWEYFSFNWDPAIKADSPLHDRTYDVFKVNISPDFSLTSLVFPE